MLGAELRIVQYAAMTWLACGVGLLPGSPDAAPGAPAPRPDNIVQFLPGVIVDRRGTTIYLMSPKNRIDAIDLPSGTRLWTTGRAGKPLCLHGGLLVAQVEPSARRSDLGIAVIDVAHVDDGVREFSVPLPLGIRSAIDDSQGARFRADANIYDGKVFVSWEYRRRPINGVAPMPGDDSASRVVSGASRIDLASGLVKPLDSGALPVAPAPTLPKRVARLVDAGNLLEPPSRIGDLLVAISRTGKGGLQAILKRWHFETGDPLPDVTLFDSALTLGARSADGHHLLASRRASHEEGSAEPYIWVVYSLETGLSVAKVPKPSPSGRFLVAGSTMLELRSRSRALINGSWVDQPRRLRATALQTGAELWERPLRDTAPQGSLPPSRPLP